MQVNYFLNFSTRISQAQKIQNRKSQVDNSILNFIKELTTDKNKLVRILFYHQQIILLLFHIIFTLIEQIKVFFARSKSKIQLMSHSWQYTPQEYRKDLMVRHMCAYPARQQDNRLSHDIVTKIQTQNDPSLDYYLKMKELKMDKLKSGRNEHNERILKENWEMQNTQRDYKENINGLLLSLEKQQDKRNDFIKKCLANQSYRARNYVDAYAMKNYKAQKLIQMQSQNPVQRARQQILEDQKNKLSPTYDQQLTKMQMYPSLKQSQSSSRINLNIPPISKAKIHSRTRTQGDMEQLQQNQNTYNDQIKKIKEDLRNKNAEYSKALSSRRIYKLHNPITNPIQYHIENPYFLKKMQEKYQ